LEDLTTAAAGIFITFLAAEASYRFVELGPLRRRIAGSFPRWAVIGGGLVAIAGTGATAHVALKAQSRLSISQTATDRASWYPDNSKPVNPAFAHCQVEFEQRPFSQGEVRIWRPHRCSLPKQQGSLIVIGDSHSLAYMPTLNQFAADTGREVRSFHRSNCPYVNVKDPIRDGSECRSYYAALDSMLRKATHAGDVVFLASLKMPRLANQTGAMEEQTDAGRKAWVAGVARASKDLLVLSQDLQSRGAVVVVEAPKPLFRSPTFRCVDWFNRRNPVCKPGFSVPRSELEAIRAPVVRATARVAMAQRNVVVWDPFPVLCPGSKCHAFRHGKPIVVDADHLSAYANELLYPSFRQTMRTAFGLDKGQRNRLDNVH
jgi:hypothetical protein